MLTKIFGGKIVKVTEISWSSNTQQKSSQYMEVVLLVALWHQMLVAGDHNFNLQTSSFSTNQIEASLLVC